MDPSPERMGDRQGQRESDPVWSDCGQGSTVAWPVGKLWGFLATFVGFKPLFGLKFKPFLFLSFVLRFGCLDWSSNRGGVDDK